MQASPTRPFSRALSPEGAHSTPTRAPTRAPRRRASRLAFAALAMVAALVVASPPARAIGDGDGFVATLWGDWTEATAIEANRLAASVGARQVSYLVHIRQETRQSSAIRWQGEAGPGPLSASRWPAVLAPVIADAHARGMAVTLVPFLWVDGGGPRHRIWPSDRAAWFRSYGERMRELGTFAATHGVDELIVGSELSLLYLDEQGWRSVIREVRSVFGGHLTLSTLFFEYPTVRFWDALDSVGVSGYFPLAFWTGIRDTWLLERVWRLHRAHLLAFAQAKGKPLTFSEVGYPATNVAATKPWDYDWASRSVDQELQARCFEAFRRVWSREPRLRRFTIWGLELPSEDQRLTGGKGFLPIGKRAEDPVRRLFAERAQP